VVDLSAGLQSGPTTRHHLAGAQIALCQSGLDTPLLFADVGCTRIAQHDYGIAYAQRRIITDRDRRKIILLNFDNSDVLTRSGLPDLTRSGLPDFSHVAQNTPGLGGESGHSSTLQNVNLSCRLINAHVVRVILFFRLYESVMTVLYCLAASLRFEYLVEAFEVGLEDSFQLILRRPSYNRLPEVVGIFGYDVGIRNDVAIRRDNETGAGRGSIDSIVIMSSEGTR
jgi:hypothetical protein